MLSVETLTVFQKKIYDHFYESYFKGAVYEQTALSMLTWFDDYTEFVAEQEILDYMNENPDISMEDFNNHFADMMPDGFWSDEIEPDDMDDKE